MKKLTKMKIILKIEKEDFYSLIVPVAEKACYTHPLFHKEVTKIRNTLKALYRSEPDLPKLDLRYK